MGFACARVEGKHGGGRAAGGEQELAPRHPDPVGGALAEQASPLDRFPKDGRQEGLGVVLAVRTRAELDG
jgi:hypothetical protein